MNGEIVRPPSTIAIVLGTRPEGIKLAPVYRALAAGPSLSGPCCG
jgi:UDP-N-acetylglucosamine 2-epimerase